MDRPAEVTLWLLKNITRLKIKIEQLTWIDRVVPGYTDVHVYLEHKGISWSGWGFGDSEDLALTKALAEAIERIVMQESDLATTNGLAAHSTLEKAKEAARGELIERDLFLCHYHTKTPLRQAPKETESAKVLKTARAWFSEQGITLHVRGLDGGGVVVIADGRQAAKPFGLTFGAGCKGSSEASLTSALLECTRICYRLMMKDTAIKSHSLDEFKKRERVGFENHGGLARDLDFANTIAWLFEKDGESVKELENDPSIIVKEVPFREKDFENCGLKFAHAASPMRQNLYLGWPTPEKMNLPRLSQFAGRNLEFKDLLELPHPFD